MSSDITSNMDITYVHRVIVGNDNPEQQNDEEKYKNRIRFVCTPKIPVCQRDWKRVRGIGQGNCGERHKYNRKDLPYCFTNVVVNDIMKHKLRDNAS